MLPEALPSSPLLRGADLPPLPPAALPAVGSTLTLSVLAIEQLGVRVTTPQGLTLLLPGLAEAGLQPGDSLLLRVVATEPRLQLAPLSPGVTRVRAEPVTSPSAGPQASTATTLPPRWTLARPQADGLAAGWQGVLQQGMQQLAQPAAANVAWLLAGQRPEHDPLQQARRLAEQGWHLAYAWPGQVLQLGWESPSGEPAACDAVLLLQLRLAPWGECWVRVAGSSGGLLLQLGCTQASVLANWHKRLPQWRQALRQGGACPVELQLCHAPLRRTLAAGHALPAYAAFRLAAQLLLLLQQAAQEDIQAAQQPPSLPQGISRHD